MKMLRLLFVLSCVSLLAVSYSLAGDQGPAKDQPKDKPACTCCCKEKKDSPCDAPKDCKDCCCANDKAGNGAAEQAPAKPDEPKKP